MGEKTKQNPSAQGGYKLPISDDDTEDYNNDDFNSNPKKVIASTKKPNII